MGVSYRQGMEQQSTITIVSTCPSPFLYQLPMNDKVTATKGSPMTMKKVGLPSSVLSLHDLIFDTSHSSPETRRTLVTGLPRGLVSASVCNLGVWLCMLFSCVQQRKPPSERQNDRYGSSTQFKEKTF